MYYVNKKTNQVVKAFKLSKDFDSVLDAIEFITKHRLALTEVSDLEDFTEYVSYLFSLNKFIYEEYEFDFGKFLINEDDELFQLNEKTFKRKYDAIQ